MRKHSRYLFVLLMLINVKAGAQEFTFANDSITTRRIDLGELVISGSKENTTFKSIPASVSIISSGSISDNEIQTLSDISSTAPNFFMPDYGSKLTSPVYIRGIGSRINSPSVGLYVDYVPYFEKAAFDFDFFDIKRIEVLRGPQGTLFGRNTMGGIVNIVTLSPLEYQGTHLNLSAGNYGSYLANVGHYNKINDKFGYSLALNFLHNDGFFTNQYSGNQVDKLNSYGLRNRLIYKFSDKLSVENILGSELSKQGGYPYAIYNDSLDVAEKINYNQYSSYNRTLFSDALLVKYSGNKYEMVATTSFQYLDDIQDIDQDFTPDSLYFISQTQNQNMLSQEIVMRSSGDPKYKWLFGGYGFYQGFDNVVDVDVYASKMSYVKSYDHVIKGMAAFHQSTISDFLVRNLAITGGIRLDTEQDLLDYQYDRNLKGVQANLADTVYPALKSVEVIPRLAINYKVKNSNYYLVIARGYKTGGFNTTFERPEDLSFDPEYSWNYEFGVKTPLLKSHLYADVALFYIDWKNQQIYQTVPSGRGSMLKNAGHSASKGLEVSLKTIPLRGYEFTAAYGYTHATFLSYVVDSLTNHNNNYLPYVPRNTISLQASRSIKLKDNSVLDNIRLNLLYRGAGEIFWDEENSHKQEFYGLLDAKISFGRKSFQFDIWSKNLLNTEYASFYFEALGNKYVQTGRPAQVGVNLSLKF